MSGQDAGFYLDPWQRSDLIYRAHDHISSGPAYFIFGGESGVFVSSFYFSFDSISLNSKEYRAFDFLLISPSLYPPLPIVIGQWKGGRMEERTDIGMGWMGWMDGVTPV